LKELVLRPIGVVRTPFREKAETPRQPAAARDSVGRIELIADSRLQHALEDLDGWQFVWVLFWFHLNTTWRPKVLPPRSIGRKRRGTFSTRSPYRPNPIGLSAVELLRVEGRVLHVRGVDMIDGTPVLDIKPYVPYTDAMPDARSGWLEKGAGASSGAPGDPEAPWRVVWSDRAREQCAWLANEHGVALAAAVERVLSLGPQPHPYRRIRPDGDGFRLAVKDWRVAFHVGEARCVIVDSLASGYRPAELARGLGPRDAHRAFRGRFGA
jgi:tRNA-Thr(GGU) m(6)t(6)A37 methyltransferase TsaA